MRSGVRGPVAGVVLAAGAGRRMGRPKGLLELAGTPLVAVAARTLQAGGCDPVAVVTGADDAAVGRLVEAVEGVQAVRNAGWARGQGSSVATAIGWAGEVGAAAVVVLPVDTPGITPAVVARVRERWADDPDRAAVATYDGAPRNPALLPATVWGEVIAALDGDVGAGPWLRANPDRVVPVPCEDVGDPADLDTPEDLDAWIAGGRPDRTT